MSVSQLVSSSSVSLSGCYVGSHSAFQFIFYFTNMWLTWLSLYFFTVPKPEIKEGVMSL